jgi:hypothetical protein
MVMLLFLSSELMFVCVCVGSAHTFPGSKANIPSTMCCGQGSLFRMDAALSQGDAAAVVIGSEQTRVSISVLGVHGLVEAKRTQMSGMARLK